MHESRIRQLFRDHGIMESTMNRVIEVAKESEKDASPATVEGRLLHDAHLLEGDENFLITKSLVTGSARGQSLAETLAYLETYLGKHRCCSEQNQAEYERRVQIARTFIAKLKPEL
jgi:uncharacterized protein